MKHFTKGREERWWLLNRKGFGERARESIAEKGLTISRVFQ